MSEVKHGTASRSQSIVSEKYIDEVCDQATVVGLQEGITGVPTVSLLFSKTTIIPNASKDTSKQPFDVARMYVANITMSHKDAQRLADHILKGLEAQKKQADEPEAQ